MSLIIRPNGFNDYYCTFVTVFKCNIYISITKICRERVDIRQIIFMKSGIICVTLSFLIFNIMVIKIKIIKYSIYILIFNIMDIKIKKIIFVLFNSNME